MAKEVNVLKAKIAKLKAAGKRQPRQRGGRGERKDARYGSGDDCGGEGRLELERVGDDNEGADDDDDDDALEILLQSTATYDTAEGPLAAQ